MEIRRKSTTGSSAREPHGAINIIDRNSMKIRRKSTTGSSAREPHGAINIIDRNSMEIRRKSTTGSSAREPHGAINIIDRNSMEIRRKSTTGSSAREPHGAINIIDRNSMEIRRKSTTGSSAREPHGAINIIDRNSMEIRRKSTTGSSAREPHGAINIIDGKMDVHIMSLSDHSPTMTPLDQKPFLRVPDSPYYNVHPMRSSGKGPSFKTYFKNIDFQRNIPTSTPAPPPRASYEYYLEVTALVSVLGAIVALIIFASVRRGKASRTRRGRFSGAGAVQESRPSISTDPANVPNSPRQPTGQGEPGPPLNDDLPPSYYECALSSIKKYVNDEPPPYAKYKDAELQERARRQNALIENGLGTKAVTMTTTSNDSGDVTPEMKTELVFDNGRIVERLSLDLDDNNVKTERASNDNVERQSTRHAEVKDKVMYVDEADNVKVLNR